MNNEPEHLRRRTAELENKLQQSEDRFNKLFHAASNMMTITTLKEGRMLDLNEASASFGDYKREELIGHLPADHSLFADPKQRETLVWKLENEGKAHNLEMKMRTKAGDIRTILLSADPITVDEEPCLLGISIDITEREKEANILRESEEKYRLLVENSLQGLAIIQDKRVVFCNSAFASIAGYSVEEVMSASDMKSAIHPDDYGVVFERYCDQLAGKPSPSQYEHRIVRKDGTVRWVEIYASRMQYNGKPALQVVNMDITERKRMEEALRESEEKYRIIALNTADVIVVMDINTMMPTFMSPSIERLRGFTAAEALSRTPEQTMTPESLRRVRKVIEEEIRLEASGTADPNRKRITEAEEYRKDGSTVWVESAASFIRDRDGKAVGILTIARDISERKKAEAERERFMAAIEQSGETIFITDAAGIILYVNPAFKRTTGYSREEAIGQTPRLFKSGEQDAAFYRELWATISSGNNWKGRIVNRSKDGSRLVEAATISPVCDTAGRIVNYVAIKRDITEHLRLEAQFQQAQKMEAVGVLAGGVAHDFNNLLTVIKGYAEILMEDFASDDPKRRDLDQIVKAGQQAASLTMQLLAFSRKQILQPKILNLNDVLEETSKMLRRLIGEDIELVAITQPGLGQVNADPVRLQQIIMNLAVNARDAMPHGGKLTIETANVDIDENYVRKHPLTKTGSHVMLAISDNGIGMDSVTQARIFEPFFTTKGKGKGTGLGLSTVYGIVNQSNGFIWVYSEPGKGATFKIYLPRVQGEAAKLSSDANVKPDLRGTETILVVEDDPSVRALACRILRGQGYTILQASNGQDAMNVSQEYAGKIHFILTDVVMPGMSGKDLVSQLKVARPGVKALYVSGYADNAIVHQGTLDSNVAFLQKPFTVESLARKVREVINS